MSALKVFAIPALKDNFIYALSDADNRCAIIDPGEAQPVLDFLRQEKLNLAKILCTHHHHDHVDGVAELVGRFHVPVLSSQPDLARISHATHGLSEGVSELFNEEMRVIEVPGHTLGQISFWFPKMSALFVGDTLFSCGCGRLFEGTFEQMFASLNKFKKLPGETKIYFGHEYTLSGIQFLIEHGEESGALADYKRECEHKIGNGKPTTPTLLKTEMLINPFLRANSLAEFRKWREARDIWRLKAH